LSKSKDALRALRLALVLPVGSGIVSEDQIRAVVKIVTAEVDDIATMVRAVEQAGGALAGDDGVVSGKEESFIRGLVIIDAASSVLGWAVAPHHGFATARMGIFTRIKMKEGGKWANFAIALALLQVGQRFRQQFFGAGQRA